MTVVYLNAAFMTTVYLTVISALYEAGCIRLQLSRLL